MRHLLKRRKFTKIIGVGQIIGNGSLLLCYSALISYICANRIFMKPYQFLTLAVCLTVFGCSVKQQSDYIEQQKRLPALTKAIINRGETDEFAINDVDLANLVRFRILFPPYDEITYSSPHISYYGMNWGQGGSGNESWCSMEGIWQYQNNPPYVYDREMIHNFTIYNR